MNDKLKVNALTVRGFRGIHHEMSLQLGDITILKGENGTGKSSFVNAIEYLFSKDLAFLKNKTINTTKAAFNFSSSPGDAKIELRFKNKKYIKFENSSRENSSVFDDILENKYVKNASFILNRKKLLNFIDGTQGNRYKAVMDLCGMEEIDKIQSAISSSTSTIKKKLDSLSANYAQKLSELSVMLFERDDAGFDECIQSINAKLEKNSRNTITEDTDIDEFIANLDLSDFSLVIAKIHEFDEIFRQCDFNMMKFKLDNLLSDYESIACDNLKSSQSLLKTLNTSFEYIRLTGTDKCPVCENPIDASEILPQISSKIDDINANSSAFNAWKNELDELINFCEMEIGHCRDLNSVIVDLNKLMGDILPDFEYGNLCDFKADLIQFKDFNKLAGDFRNVEFSSLTSEISSIRKLIFDYELEHNIDDLSEMYTILFSLKHLKELENKINKVSRQHNLSSKTFEIFIQSKEKFINDMIYEIRHDIKTYYEFIHGDDLISQPDIELTGPKLIDVYLNSFGEKVDSRSYASEGHLDTLGICIFLAFNKKFNQIPFIVFDDVFTTVDLPHKERIGKMIVEKLTGYKFLITTHSPLWSEQLKKLCADSKRNCTIYEFIDWSLEEGPIIMKPMDSEQRIEKYLSNDYLDLQAAANTARRYLEYTLTQICIQNKVKVLISDRYEVGTLFDDAKRHTLRAVRGTSLEGYYEYVWSEINKSKHIANPMSHYNEQNEQIPKNDIVKFCEDVIRLNHAFTCHCGKSILKLDPVSHKLICSNPKCRDAIDMNGFADIVLKDTGKEMEF